VSVTWAEKIDQKLASVLVPEKMSWATATRSIRECKTRIEKIGPGSRVDTEKLRRVLMYKSTICCGQETLAKFQTEKGNDTSDDKGSDDMTSKAERKRKSDASPVEFCHRSLVGVNV